MKKVLIVYPSAYGEEGQVVKSPVSYVVPRILPYLAALLPSHYEPRLVDELVDDLDFEAETDLVLLTGMLRHMPRAIDIGRGFRKRGKPVVIGGPGAFSIKDDLEKSGAFDSIVIGEAESLLEPILRDFEKGELKKSYFQTEPPDLSGFPHARFDLLKTNKYMKSIADKIHIRYPIETSRGCPYNCHFCLVTKLFGKRMRYRPIPEVVAEIQAYGGKSILFTDDNIAINPRRARELFQALIPLKIKWLGQFDSQVIKDPDLLKLAAKAGCVNAFVGIESLNQENLSEFNKTTRRQQDIGEIVKAFRKAGIILFASLIFGLDKDTPQSIEATVNTLKKLGVGIAIPWLLTPFPGTRVYDDYKKEGRILHENYSQYDCWHPVIRPKSMSTEDMEKAYWKGLRSFYSIPSIIIRVLWNRKFIFPGFIVGFLYRKQVLKGLHPFSGLV